VEQQYLRVFDVIDRLEALSDPQEVWREFLNYSSSFGLTTGGVADLPRADEALQETIAFVNWPEEWQQRYFLHDYVRRDPAVLHMQNTQYPFLWSEVLARPEYDKSQQTIVREASEFKMREGFVVPLPSMWSGAAVITVAGECVDASPRERRQLHLAAIYAHARIRILSREKRKAILLPPLTPRERECLKWAAVGKSDHDIGAILSISHKTVNAFLERVKVKYGVRTRTQAVALALQFGVISV
jgi:LuxR family quorum sensing-dependent transcriptional regulator